MSAIQARLPAIAAKTIVVVGVAIYLPYLLYLPLPDSVAAKGATEFMSAEALGLLLYIMATGGAAFVSWGMIMGEIGEGSVSKQEVLKASAIGVGLLALMRFELALFPHAPFDGMLFLPIGESVLFFVIAVFLYRA